MVQQTIDSEINKLLFRNLRDVVKPTQRSAISHIEVPRLRHEPPTQPGTNTQEILGKEAQENIQWDTVIERADIEKHLLTYNRQAFQAAAKSQLGHGIIYNSITFSSLSKSASQLLKGHVPHSWHGDDLLLKDFLASYAIPPTIKDSDQINTSISEEDVKKGFKNWNEQTTTSPSGRHLGHYKAIIQDHKLLRYITLFLNIALTNGITILHWSEATNIMIEKDPGIPKITRLRIIHLFEADFNFIMKLMWGHRLVRRTIELDLLHTGQHGMIPGRSTLDPIMLTQLTLDISRVQKTNAIRFDNDASACYDRIIVALGMLAARRCGMPDNAIRTLAKTLEWMRYTVKIVYGISKDNYQGTKSEPLFGTGQGSGASPSV